jgi:hypothetical protein
VGLTATLLGGCPLRQLVLSSEGDLDAGAVVFGMITGAAVAHNFMFAASACRSRNLRAYRLYRGYCIYVLDRLELQRGIGGFKIWKRLMSAD